MPVPSMIRTRWAAIGAAVAVSIGAGGVGLINATSPDGAAAFVPITPCRLFDTRPAPHTVGGRTAPLGPDETYDISAHGEQGHCAVPSTAVGLVLNVTAVDATHATFLTLFPTGTERPTASHLNPTPGAPPAPNAVTVDLSGDGKFSVFNRFGSVHVIGDVVGYYTDHHHDDRYYTEPEVDAVAAQLQAVLDSRVPVADSMTLAGGAFIPLDAELELASGSACFKPTGTGDSMRHSIPVTAGSTVTAITARTRNPTVYPATFTLRIFAQRASSADGVTVHVASIAVAPDTPLHETRIELPTPELVDAGEAVYVAFYQPGNPVYLCAVDVEFTRPG